MKLTYNTHLLEFDDSIINVAKMYATELLRQMQEHEPDAADAWTACIITFDELNPMFQWGSIEDLKEVVVNNGAYIEYPLKKDALYSPKDIVIDTVSSKDSVGKSRGKGMSVGELGAGVKVTHTPTGLYAECYIHRNTHSNKKEAVALLNRQLEQQKNMDAIII